MSKCDLCGGIVDDLYAIATRDDGSKYERTDGSFGESDDHVCLDCLDCLDCLEEALETQSEIFHTAQAIVDELRTKAAPESLLSNAIAREGTWEEIAEAAEELFPVEAARLKKLAEEWEA